MAEKKSTIISNVENVPPKAVDGRLWKGRGRVAKATIAVAAADDDGDVLRMLPVHSSWKIHSIKVFNDAITGGTAYDFGLYETTENGGAAVDDDAYASAVDLSSAGVGTEVAFEARDINKMEQSVWQDAGQSEDPNKYYDLCLTGDTIGTAAGDISIVVEFTGDG